jgi:hypothetical protein
MSTSWGNDRLHFGQADSAEMRILTESLRSVAWQVYQIYANAAST